MIWSGMALLTVPSCQHFTSLLVNLPSHTHFLLLPFFVHSCYLSWYFSFGLLFYSSVPFVYFLIIVTAVSGLLHFFPLKIRFRCYNHTIELCIIYGLSTQTNKKTLPINHKWNKHKWLHHIHNQGLNGFWLYLIWIDFAMRFFYGAMVSPSHKCDDELFSQTLDFIESTLLWNISCMCILHWTLYTSYVSHNKQTSRFIRLQFNTACKLSSITLSSGLQLLYHYCYSSMALCVFEMAHPFQCTRSLAIDWRKCFMN